MIIDNYFWQQMRTARSRMTRAQRRRTRNRRPRGIKYPFGLEKEYARIISGEVKNFIVKSLIKLEPYLVKHGVKLDNAGDDLNNLLLELEQMLEVYNGGTYVIAPSIGQSIYTIAEKLFGKHSAFFQEEVKVLTGGATIPMDYSWWNEAETFWRQENLRLIKSLNQEYINRLNDLIMSSVQGNLKYEELLTAIESLSSSLSGYRARRIARDQIGKLNGVIAKYQQTSIGMETYHWHTMGDEKVRGDPTGIYAKAVPQHFYLDNMLCSWDNASVYSDDLGVTWKTKPSTWVQTHPGMTILCRCISYASWGYMLSSIDKEIEGEV